MAALILGLGMMRVMDDDRALYFPDGDGYVATLRTQGGWHPEHQHGGPVQALLARAVEQTPTLVPMSVARLTHDLFRPVPIGPRLTVSAEIVREGKKIQVVDAVLRVGDVEHARTRALRLRDDDLSDLPGMLDAADAGPELPWAQDLEATWLRGIAGLPGFLDAIELRRFPRPGGPEGVHATWVRLNEPLVPGEAPSPLQKLSVAADFTNLIGATFDAHKVSGINPDLNLHLVRLPRDDWIAVVGESRLGLSTGIGVSQAQLHDRSGVCAVSSNSQLIQRR
jgi:Thioesterase-like superfamily